MRKARALTLGNRIAIVAPASPFARDEFDRGIAEIRTLGFEPVYDESVFARSRLGYVAGTPEIRAAAINAAWSDPSIAGLIGVRGGYGSAQVLPLLDRDLGQRVGKPFVGYSDLTALLTFHTSVLGLVAFHGPMLAGRLGRGAEGYDADSFERALCRLQPIGELTAPGVETIRGGEAARRAARRHGDTIARFAGHAVCIRSAGGLRPVSRRGRRAAVSSRSHGHAAAADRAARACGGGGDRRAAELRRAGRRSTARAVMADLFADFPGPVLIGFPSGHTVTPAMTLPFGVAAASSAAQGRALVIEEAAVE